MPNMFFDTLLEAVNSGAPSVPLWIVLASQLTEFGESKWLLMQTIEQVLKRETLPRYMRGFSKFLYDIIMLEEKLRAGERANEDLGQILFQAYSFIRSTYFDFDLKSILAQFDPLALMAKSLRSSRLCKTLKSLLVEIVAMVKLRLGRLVPEAETPETFLALVLPTLCATPQ